MHRRHFLGLMAVTALRAASTTPVGAHCWVFAARQPGYDPYPVLEDVFREFKSGGVDGVELMHQALLHDDSVAKVKELAKKHTLPVLGSSWSPVTWDVSQRAQVLQEGRTLIPRIQQAGGHLLGMSVGDARRKKTSAEFDAQVACLREINKMCRDHGVEMNLHNHVYEVANGEYDLGNTLERMPEARLGPDIGWLFRAKLDPVDFIRRHGPRIVYAHLRNEKADGKWPETMAEGVIDYKAVGEALRQAGFKGTLAIELAHERDFTPTQSYGASVKASREYVRRVMGY